MVSDAVDFPRKLGFEGLTLELSVKTRNKQNSRR